MNARYSHSACRGAACEVPAADSGEHLVLVGGGEERRGEGRRGEERRGEERIGEERRNEGVSGNRLPVRGDGAAASHYGGRA